MSTIIIARNGTGSWRRCDSKCHDAEGKKCTCVCGGKNHGVGAWQAAENMTKEGVEVLERDNPEWKFERPQRQGELFSNTE